MLNNFTRNGAMIKLDSFKTRLEIKSKPHDLLGSKLFRISNISESVVLGNRADCWTFMLLKYSIGSLSCPAVSLSNSAAIVFPTVLK